MSNFPPQVTHATPGWRLVWADLVPRSAPAEVAAALLSGAADFARRTYTLETLASNPTANAVRKLFRAAGCDPTRYRPSSEALLRRLLKGEELPAIHPLVDLNNALSVRLAVPSCVMDVAAVAPPFVLRTGSPGETMQSMRGPLDLTGKPLLADVRGPFGTPITDGEHVKVTGKTERAWLVAYVPIELVPTRVVEDELARLLAAAPVADLLGTGSTN